MRRALVLLALLCASRGAAAQPADGPDLVRARKLHATAQRFYEQGDYAAALDAFEQAYAAAPRANGLFSRAQAHKKLFFASGDRAHRAKAIELYRAFLAAAPKSERTKEATAAIEALGPADASPAEQVAPTPLAVSKPKTTLAIDSLADGARVSVDGGPGVRAPASVEVTPGRHVVRVTAPGYEPREVTVLALPNQATPETVQLVERNGTIELVAPDMDLFVHIDGVPMGSARSFSVKPGSHYFSITGTGIQSGGTPVRVARGRLTKVSFEPAATPQRYAAITLLAAGGAAILAGGVTLGLALDRDARAARIDDARSNGSITQGRFDDYRALHAERDAFRTAGIATAVAGGTIGVLGLTLFFVDSPGPIDARPDSERQRLEPPAPQRELVLGPLGGPASAGAAVRATF